DHDRHGRPRRRLPRPRRPGGDDRRPLHPLAFRLARRPASLRGVRGLAIMTRYATLLWIQVRASLSASMQYRADFVISGLMSLWWMIWTLVPLGVVFAGRGSIAGWSFPEALIVAAWFTILRGVLEASVNPSLVMVSEHIRTGTLDFVLVKPADGQFLVSTAR